MKTQSRFMLRATICALALFSLLSYPLPVSARNSISVRVICKIGVGVANVQVQLIPRGTANNPGYDFQTDKNGRVSFKNIRSGTYDIVVTCGAATFTHTIYTGAGLASFSHDYVFRCCPTPPGAPPNPDDGLIAIDDKVVTSDVAASSRAASKAVAAYTRDWQPGDEVSFSFSGNVYGPSGEKQTQDDYTGDFVGIVDSQGNKTEIPWSKLLRYKVAEGATSVAASLMKPDRTIITTANIPVHPKGTPLPIQLPPKITGNCVAYPVSQIGQPYTVYDPNGRFSGDANKMKLRTTNKIDNATTESNAVAASPRSALFNPQDKTPGSYEYTVIDEGRFEDSFDVSAVGIKLDTSRAYRVNQEGTLAIIVALPTQADAQQKLFSENFQVTTEMETPSVLAFSNGQNPVVWSLQKSEVANNQARKEFSVRAGAPGTFTITARAKTPRCNNPSVTTTKGGERVVVSGPGLLFKGEPGNAGSMTEDQCAGMEEEEKTAEAKIREKEAELANLVRFPAKDADDALKRCQSALADAKKQLDYWDGLVKAARRGLRETDADFQKRQEEMKGRRDEAKKRAEDIEAECKKLKALMDEIARLKDLPNAIAKWRAEAEKKKAEEAAKNSKVPPKEEKCVECTERNESKHDIQTFEIMDENSTITVQFYTDKDGAVNGLKNMAGLFKKPVPVLKALAPFLPGVPAKIAVKLLIEYLKQSGGILDEIATGRLATLGVSTVYVQIDVNTVEVAVEKWTVEVCRDGVWRKEIRCKESRRGSAYKKGDKIDKNDGTGRWTDISSTNEGFDPAKVDKWVKDFVNTRLGELEENESNYKAFVLDCQKKDCPKPSRGSSTPQPGKGPQPGNFPPECGNGGRSASIPNPTCPQIIQFYCCSAADSVNGHCKPEATYYNVLSVVKPDGREYVLKVCGPYGFRHTPDSCTLPDIGPSDARAFCNLAPEQWKANLNLFSNAVRGLLNR